MMGILSVVAVASLAFGLLATLSDRLTADRVDRWSHRPWRD